MFRWISGKWFITLIQLWHKNEKQLKSNIIVCIICDFSFYSNTRSNIGACCVFMQPVWWSELEVKTYHLFHNPWQESILNVNPSQLEIVTIGGGKGEGLDKSWRRMTWSISQYMTEFWGKTDLRWWSYSCVFFFFQTPNSSTPSQVSCY